AVKDPVDLNPTRVTVHKEKVVKSASGQTTVGIDPQVLILLQQSESFWTNRLNKLLKWEASVSELELFENMNICLIEYNLVQVTCPTVTRTELTLIVIKY
ncbi:unnamed protein product, partial [Thlaspi arvense]